MPFDLLVDLGAALVHYLHQRFVARGCNLRAVLSLTLLEEKEYTVAVLLLLQVLEEPVVVAAEMVVFLEGEGGDPCSALGLSGGWNIPC